MGGELEMLRERITHLEEENENLQIEKEIALTKMEQVKEIVLLMRLHLYIQGDPKKSTFPFFFQTNPDNF